MSVSLLLTILLGAGTGAAIWALFHILRPQPAGLTGLHNREVTALSVAELRSRRTVGALKPAGLTTETRVGGAFLGLATRIAGEEHFHGLTKRLRIMQMSVEQFIAGQVLLVGVFAVTSLFTVGALIAAGFNIALPIVLLLLLASVALGVGYPYFSLGDQVAGRKREFTYTFSTYLSLVALHISGGASLGTALNDASELGDGWVWEELRLSLLRARASTKTEHQSIAQLGDELDIPALQEFAGHLALAEEGAGPEASVTSFSEALHGRLVADINSIANDTTESMSLPPILLVIGLITFLLFGVIDGLSISF